MRSTRDDPSNGELARGDALLLRDDLHGVNEGHVVLEVLFVETSHVAAHITRLKEQQDEYRQVNNVP